MGRVAIAACVVWITGCAQMLGLDDRVIDAGPGCSTMYLDADGDGHGNPYAPIGVCDAPPAGAVSSNDDCSPSDRTTHAGADELCDAVDNDCDTVVDENACPFGCSAARRPPPNYDRIFVFCATTAVPWLTAETNCIGAGGHLADIQGPGENDFVVSIAMARIGTGSVWIGGADPIEGQWSWQEPSIQFSMGATCIAGMYCNWSAGQPSNSSTGEDCLELAMPAWNDEVCTTLKPYVCRL